MKEKTALEYLSIAFDIARDNYGILFLNYLIYSIILYFLIYLIFVPLNIIFSILGVLVIPLIFAGYYIFVLKIKRKENSNIGEFILYGFLNERWLEIIILQIVLGIAVVIGIFLFVIPGLYLTITWSLSIFFLLDKNMSIVDSLSKSRESIHQIGIWKLSFLIITMTLITQLLIFVPVVGIIINLGIGPIIVMVYVVIYEDSIGNLDLIDQN
tara:strand:+ start:85 stop:720 length:636 start_codon:yes stop_codon:yes gene_type:complete